ncbi:glycoside hydrolase [Clavulina sp. PMI_390]|nr:glycoside hydrolase [Clavulina sp. PMI_390]
MFAFKNSSIMGAFRAALPLLLQQNTLLPVQLCIGDGCSTNCSIDLAPPHGNGTGSGGGNGTGGGLSTLTITDVWQTTWDGTGLFAHSVPNPAVKFLASTATNATVHISINENVTYQQMQGIGASLTDSSALVLSRLKHPDCLADERFLQANNVTAYNSLLSTLFDPTFPLTSSSSSSFSSTSASLSYLRLPLGATDLSATAYSYDDTTNDTSLASFSIDKVVPSYVFDVLADVLKVSKGRVKVHVCPWSMPGWMKDSGTVDGGNFLSQYTNSFADYLFKSVQAWSAKGLPIFAVSIQNNNPTYPTALLDAATEGQIAITLRTLLDSNGFSSVRIIGYESNWVDETYPGAVMTAAPNALAGISFHCYAGTVDAQTTFKNAWPKAEVYQTECADVPGTDWWTDIKWMTNGMWIGAPNNWAGTAAMWSLAAEPNGDPLLPGTTSCGQGCRGVMSVTANTSWEANQEFYGMAHASKALVPQDTSTNSQWAVRISSNITGSNAGFITATAYKAPRTNSSGGLDRYSLVVLNSNDGENSAGVGWNPQPLTLSIAFQGKQIQWTFPVGLTT